MFKEKANKNESKREGNFLLKVLTIKRDFYQMRFTNKDAKKHLIFYVTFILLANKFLPLFFPLKRAERRHQKIRAIFYSRLHFFIFFLLCFAFQQKKTAQSMCRSTEWYLQDFKFCQLFLFGQIETFYYKFWRPATIISKNWGSNQNLKVIEP